MKRFWHSWTAVFAAVAMISPAVAQNDLGQYSEIGSYQSILSRAGYPTTGYDSESNSVSGHATAPAATVPVPPSNSVYRQPYQQDVAPADVAPGEVTPGVTETPAIPLTPANPIGQIIDGTSSGGCDSGCGGAVYTPGQDIGVQGQGANYVVGVGALIFDRDYESHRSVSATAAGDRLYTTDADHETIGGVDFSLTKRNCNNRGWQVRYWGLYPDTATASLTGAPVYLTGNWRGLDQINHVGSGANVWDIFQQGDVQTVYRETEIHNVEFNFLNNAGCYTTRRGRRGNSEIIAGFRWFQFDEILGVNSDSTFGGYPASITYNSEVENTLLGFQVGNRQEVCVSNRWRLGGAVKMGIYNNRINSRQSIYDDTGAFAQVGSGAYAGQDYSWADQKDDLAFLGELDLNIIRQLGAKSRLVVGYRAIGVSGVALTDSQTPYDYTDVFQITRTNSDDSLLLHGGYAGLEFCR